MGFGRGSSCSACEMCIRDSSDHGDDAEISRREQTSEHDRRGHLRGEDDSLGKHRDAGAADGMAAELSTVSHGTEFSVFAKGLQLDLWERPATTRTKWNVRFGLSVRLVRCIGMNKDASVDLSLIHI